MWDWIRRLLWGDQADDQEENTTPTSYVTPPEIQQKVLMIVFDPVVPSAGGRRLTEVMGWSDPEDLAVAYIQNIEHSSYGYGTFTIVEKMLVDNLPVKVDGFAYNPDTFVQLLRAGSGFHHPDTADYQRLLIDFGISQKIASGVVDEVWLFGPPYGGFFESCMGGPGAFWCNGPVVGNTEDCQRRFVIMGFSYERGVGEMLENMGHRTESTMERVFRRSSEERNLWHRSLRHEKTHPGKSEVGTVHYAPNSSRDYEWGNPTPVLSRCDTWYRYPDLEGEPRNVDCSEWGNGDIRLHHVWWLRHLPHFEGQSNGFINNWWQYILKPDTVS